MTVHLPEIRLTGQLSTSTTMMEVTKIKRKQGQINGIEGLEQQVLHFLGLRL
jgi:hypothetical protein